MSDKQKHINSLAIEISSQLHKLEVAFWEAYLYPETSEEYFEGDDGNMYLNYEREDKITFLYHGTKTLYYKICLFIELKGLPLYFNLFVSKFQTIIEIEKEVRADRGPLYNDDEPSMIIHDDFRSFLMPFTEFNLTDHFQKLQIDKLRQILENTNSILKNTNTIIKNEASIYNPVKWFVEVVYPTARNRNVARFIKKFKTYHPDILIPEISSAVEYKFIKQGIGIETYLDQIKTDADNYDGDPEYKVFYAVVFFEDKGEINPAAFKQAVVEKNFPDNWTILPV